MKKFNFVYLTTNILNNKQYVGDHSTNDLSDNYLGSGKLLLLAIKKYGRKNFRKEILENCKCKQNAFFNQEKWINEYNTLVPTGYNISPKGGLKVRGCHSKETKLKISNSNKGKKISLKQKIAASIFHKGKKLSSITKEKISKTQMGHNVSYETRKKLSEIKIELFKNIESPLKNRIRSEETKRKISKSKKINPLIYTDEMKLKMSLAKKGKSPWNKGIKITQ